jgi:hypothetical protein
MDLSRCTIKAILEVAEKKQVITSDQRKVLYELAKQMDLRVQAAIAPMREVETGKYEENLYPLIEIAVKTEEALPEAMKGLALKGRDKNTVKLEEDIAKLTLKLKKAQGGMEAVVKSVQDEDGRQYKILDAKWAPDKKDRNIGHIFIESPFPEAQTPLAEGAPGIGEGLPVETAEEIEAEEAAMPKVLTPGGPGWDDENL